MNQRFQNAEIRLVSERYAENELYKAIKSLGTQLENDMTEFGLCPEECLMETLELLSIIAEKGEDVLPEVNTRWLDKENEYRRFNRNVNFDEIRKAVGIVFGFAVLAIDSSRHPFYRRKLTESLTSVIANHKFSNWSTTLNQIFAQPLPDGWFDAFIEENPDGGDDLSVWAKNINTICNQRPDTLIFVQNQYNKGCQQFMGKMENPTFVTPTQNEAV